MLKYIVIMIVVGYVLSKISSMIFRVMRPPRPTPNFRRPPDGHIHVDSVPKKEKKNGMKGGDYVDYEEVK